MIVSRFYEDLSVLYHKNTYLSLNEKLNAR